MTNFEPSTIERNVMRRVQRARLLRFIISVDTFALFIFILALYGIGREVWVARVFQNMPHSGNVNALFHFWFSAFLHTHFIVEALSILTLACLIFLAREVAHTLAPRHIFARV